MKTIVLSGTNPDNLSVKVDSEDYPLLSRHKWYIFKGRSTLYAQRNIREAQNELLHALIMGAPPKPGLVVDHINNDGLDNRKENLRWLPNAENIRRHYEENPYTGISYKEHLQSNPWKASVSFMGKNVHVGYYWSQEAAREARDAKLAELLAEAHGEE